MSSVRTGLQERSERHPGQLATAEDLAHHTGPDRFARMNRNERRPPVRMPQELVAGAGPDHREAGLLQGSDDLLPGQGRPFLHRATVTCWTPTKSRGSSVSPSTSK